jgi:adenosine/AMP kinase
LVLAVAGVLFAQTAPNKTLVVNGKNAGAIIRQIDGHSYVDIESLAQATNGVVTVEPRRIVLTIPSAEAAPVAVAVAATPAVAPAPVGISRDFAAAAIAELAEMREWRGAVSAMVRYGMAVSDTWAQDYHAHVEEGLRATAVLAATDADQSALQLLRSEADNENNWANTVLAARQTLNGAATVDPNAQQNDATLAKIRKCGQFLNGMIVSGGFADDPSCH